MTTKERLHKLVDGLSAAKESEAAKVLAELQSETVEKNTNGDSKAREPKKVGRLSFFGIGASGAPDVSERFDEYLGRAIDRRHPRS